MLGFVHPRLRLVMHFFEPTMPIQGAVLDGFLSSILCNLLDQTITKQP